VKRTETGRRRQDHVVHAGIDHTLVSVQADEAAIVRDVVVVGEVLLELPAQAVDMGFVHVTQGDDLHAFRRFRAILDGTAAAPATADQTDAQRVAAGSVYCGHRAKVCDDGRSHGRYGRGANEIPARGLSG
jgi:hypothetical protein